MNTPTRSAPHICLKVRPKKVPNIPALSRPLIPRNTRIRSHDARIDVPAMNGVQLKVASEFLWLIDETATADTLYQLIAGNADAALAFQGHHGAVHRTTTTTRMMKGRIATSTSLAGIERGAAPGPENRGREAAAAGSGVSIGTPPKPRISFGRQMRRKS